jgi:hypothetical protein
VALYRYSPDKNAIHDGALAWLRKASFTDLEWPEIWNTLWTGRTESELVRLGVDGSVC